MNNVSLFHSFSKVAAADNTALSAAVNKAGHVVTASDVWANEIPFCGSADSLADIKTKFADNTAFPVGTLGYDLSTSKLYQKGKEDWSEITPAAVGGYVTISYKEKPVLRWYNKAHLTLLTPDNNGAPSNGFSAKYLGPNGDGVGAISQFVSSTDKIVNGIVSDGYDIAVYNDTTKLTKGTSTAAADNQWMDSAYAGMILFMCAQTSTKLSMTCFEYAGETLHEKIESISTTAKGGVSALSDSAKNAGFSITNPEGEPPTLDIATATITDGIFASTTGNKSKLVTAGDVENFVAKNAKVSVNGTSATKIAVNGTATGSNDLVKVVVTKDTTDGVALNLTATVDVANVNAGEFSSADANKLVTAIDAEEIATNVIDESINSTDANTIGGKIKDIKDTVDDIENALSGVAQVVNDLELSTTEAISDAITESKSYTDSEIDKIEQSISDALEAHSEDIAKVEAAIEGLTTTGLTREVLADGQTTASITNPQANVIYLVKDSTSETGAYVEYLYVNGNFEAIGTTSTDLSEYVKSVKINGSAYPANSTNKGVLDLGTVVTGLYNSIPSGLGGIGNTLPNNSSVYAGIASGRMEIGVADASTNGKGLVQLAANVADGSTTDVTTAKAVKDYAQKALTVNDCRETVTENDLWCTTATLDENGNLTITHNDVINPNINNSSSWNKTITKVEDNKAYVGDEFFANIQTNMIKDGHTMFYGSELASFNGDLNNLENGYMMFYETKLASFDVDLNSLKYGQLMFKGTQNLSKFEFKSDETESLSSLVNGKNMFNDSNLELFYAKLPSLVDGSHMFAYAENLNDFSSNNTLNSLKTGTCMF